jgi:hypothetical protein
MMRTRAQLQYELEIARDHLRHKQRELSDTRRDCRYHCDFYAHWRRVCEDTVCRAIDNVWKKQEALKACTPQSQLAEIEGLTLADCLRFFDETGDKRACAIIDLCDQDDEDFEIDTIHTSEGDYNGAYVLGWRWASFVGTAFDKERDDG